MRLKLITALMAAGTLAACASNPPPPPPMAEAAPPPPPAAAPMGPVAGMYKGMADMNADMPRGCAKMTKPASVRVGANNAFTLNGMRGMIGPDGAITSRASRGGSLSGMANGSTLDVTMTKGKCSYHDTLNKA